MKFMICIALACSVSFAAIAVDTTTPKGMTVVGTEGPNKGKTFPCIYELNGDTLRICYDLSGKKQPADFKSLPTTRLYLVTYKRKK